MTRIVGVWAGAVLALMAAGALADPVPAAWLPDLGLLVAAALGLYLPGASGLVLAWSIGWTEGLLYAAPLGQYALLRMLAWAATRVASRSIHLQQIGLLAAFVAALTAADAALLLALSRSFGSAAAGAAGALGLLMPRMLVNAVVAGGIGRLVQWALGERGDRTATRGPLRLEPRPPSL